MKFESKILALNNNWRIICDKDNVGLSEKWQKKGIPSQGSLEARTPSYVHEYFGEYHGIAWYEMNFKNVLQATENDLYLLKFSMADYYSQIYINGKLAGEHYGAEDKFYLDVTKLIKKGNNRLTVRISKPHDEDVDGLSFHHIPHRNEIPSKVSPGSVYNSFGICGSVELAVTPKLYVDDTFLFANTKTGNIEIEYTVINAFDAPVEATLVSEAVIKRTGDFVNSDSFKKTFEVGATTVKRKVKVEDFLWWDIDDPNLYNVISTLETQFGAHKTTKHCGFRTFEVNEENGYFYLNGRKIIPRCSHSGNYMPETMHNFCRDKELMRKDFYMSKAVGFNMVRFFCSVALEEQLDYCDELGLMVYEESAIGWGLRDSDKAKELLEYTLFAMLKRDRSHPCITLFGFLNEITCNDTFGKDYLYARNALKAARKIDPTRVFIYSSGRWDYMGINPDPWCGSFANPFKNKWQCLWNEESDEPNLYANMRKEAGAPENPKWFPGDLHIYPRHPINKEYEDSVRNIGAFSGKPVFVSEGGWGSMFNVLWLLRRYEQMHVNPLAPDYLEVKKMAKYFLSDLKKFDFENEYPYPVDILKLSEERHCAQRRRFFDILRSNPRVNAISLTGLLDHAVCGEGFFTFMREYKPGIADVLQNGFAPVKWCIFVEETHIYRNTPICIEAVLANECKLSEGTYPVSFKIAAKNGKVVYSEDITLTLTKEDADKFAVPVYKNTLSLDVPAGEYEVRFELLEGAAATDGSVKLYVSDPADVKAQVKSVVGVYLNERTVNFLNKKGIEVKELSKVKGKCSIIVGQIPENEREELWKKLNKRMESGSRVFVLQRVSLFKQDKVESANKLETSYYLPTQAKPINYPLDIGGKTDWLYHKEYLLRREHPYFDGLPTGMMDLDYYRFLISTATFDYEECDKVPDQIQSIALSTGMPGARESRKMDGVNIGTYFVGKGALTFNAFAIAETLTKNPTADRLLINIINEEARLLKK